MEVPPHRDPGPSTEYRPRIVDEELDELLPDLPALSIEGPKAVGKTVTAARRAATVYRLDQASQRSIVEGDTSQVVEGEPPILIDEWQRVPEVFDRVRRAVDAGAAGGSFLLTGSATPTNQPVHSGAGRIVRVRMRPMTLAERGIATQTVALSTLLKGERPQVEGRAEIDLKGYVEEILRSGFPGMRDQPMRSVRAQLDGYVEHIVDREFEELGRRVRRPDTLKRWMAAYAAATATTTSFEKIRDAATSDEVDKPSRPTALSYRDILEQLWILDPVHAWLPTFNRLARLSLPFKHHLADPALAARLLGVDADILLKGGSSSPWIPRDGTLLGALFESLVTLSVRVYAQRIEGRTYHLRTRGGEHEVDLIVERGQSVVAIEVKLGVAPTDADVRHLLWLKEQIGDELADMVTLTTGSQAYRRRDGIAVVPAALLGP
jgi:hypothetical protein